MLLNTGWEQIQKESKNGKETETKKYRGRATLPALIVESRISSRLLFQVRSAAFSFLRLLRVDHWAF